MPTMHWVLAHPLTEAADLPLPPFVVATLVALALGLAWRRLPRPASGRRQEPSPPPSWATPLRGPLLVVRLLVVALVLLAVVAGRLGTTSELRNLAPALVIGVAWPLALFGALCVGDVWRWCDPFDTLARPLGALAGQPSQARGPDEMAAEGPGDVRPAAVVAAGWTAYLVVFPFPTTPRSVGTALALYLIAVVGAAGVLGRARVLGSTELFGVLVRLIADARRGQLADPAPRGALAVALIVLGGAVFGALEATALWGGRSVGPGAGLRQVGGIIVCAAALLLVVRLAARAAPRGTGAVVLSGLLPVVAAAVVALGLQRDRLLTSAVLVVSRLSDPLGSGLDLLGTAALSPASAPLGQVGRAVLQVAVLVAGGVLGLLAVRRARSASTALDGLAVATAAPVVLLALLVTTG